MTGRRPHILFLLADQLRADCVGYAGHPLLRTANIDRLAAEGIRFDRCYTTSPLCVPARMSMTTGLYPHNSHIWQNGASTPLDADTYANSYTYTDSNTRCHLQRRLRERRLHHRRLDDIRQHCHC